MQQRLWSSSAVALAAFAAACSSLIGIEEIHEGPDPAGASDGGTASGSSGTSAGGKGGAAGTGQAGTANGGGKGGTGAAGRGSGGGGGAGAGNGGSGGSTPNAGSGGAASGSAGAAGEAGAAGGGTEDSTVRGRIVSYWLQPIEDVHVMIGDASADTNEDGEFEIPDVADTYDVKFVVNYGRNGTNTASYGWVYEGLTRRDPTLQVYGGLDDQSGAVFVVPEEASFDGSRVATIAIGSDFGDSQHSPSSAAGLHGTSLWNGPDMIPAVAHGLLWNTDENDLPTSYAAYATEPLTLTTTAEANVYLSLPDGEVDSGTISGSVTSPTTEDRANKAFVRFPTNAMIELFWDYGENLDPGSFSYNVPALANGSITVMASEGDSYFGAAAVAHRGGLAAGQSDVELAIPEPPELMAPSDQDVVDEDGIFSWTSDAKTFVWHAEDQESATFQGLYVVTARKQITLPSFPNGFSLAANLIHSWRVETHGTGDTVDDLAGPEGFSDAFGESEGGEPNGPRRDEAGSYAISFSRIFTVMP
jgi:hypothetical protein